MSGMTQLICRTFQLSALLRRIDCNNFDSGLCIVIPSQIKNTLQCTSGEESNGKEYNISCKRQVALWKDLVPALECAMEHFWKDKTSVALQ